jgi:hypothetical protein
MKTIALFIHQPKCSVQSGNGIIRALGRDYRFKIFTRHELEDSFFDDVDMLLFRAELVTVTAYDYSNANSWPVYKKLCGWRWILS